MEDPKAITRHFFELISKRLNVKELSLNVGYFGGFMNGGSSKFVSRTGEVVIDLDECRTVRDIVYVVGHELFHAKQNEIKPHILSVGLKGVSTFEDYRRLPREIEADRYGIKMARELEYDNKVINRDCESLFIWTMQRVPEETLS